LHSVFALFLGIIRDISIVDLLDMVLVSYGIYRALLFIEGTRAYNLLKGLGIILGLLIVTKDLDFNTVSWILSNALPTGFLALVVIFQPELRRVLEDIGKGSFLVEQLVAEDEIPEIVEEICKTVETCSKKRIGALIVLEQEIGLKDFIDNGVQLHSKITSELLNTIFAPFTPLHDGAVIIKGQYVEAASCFLPMTNNHADISKEIGSRHRAAMGITEITDAIVIVVSEETGNISKSSGGKLTQNLSMDRVKKLITASFNRMTRRKRIFKGK
jgi:diadenylate cyclase